MNNTQFRILYNKIKNHKPVARILSRATIRLGFLRSRHYATELIVPRLHQPEPITGRLPGSVWLASLITVVPSFLAFASHSSSTLVLNFLKFPCGSLVYDSFFFARCCLAIRAKAAPPNSTVIGGAGTGVGLPDEPEDPCQPPVDVDDQPPVELDEELLDELLELLDEEDELDEDEEELVELLVDDETLPEDEEVELTFPDDVDELIPPVDDEVDEITTVPPPLPPPKKPPPNPLDEPPYPPEPPMIPPLVEPPEVESCWFCGMLIFTGTLTI